MNQRTKTILAWAFPIFVLLVGVIVVKIHVNPKGFLEGPKAFGGYFGATLTGFGGLGLGLKMPKEET